ncbi:uncharacterized protein A4U43_C05F12230 [Asparagus officinalis]|uniref:Uncharacterized protein n=1 Tax=Asparagus officinalis TaxID=4686 RepID=A0A5P1ERB7_ASPOF|nr:uncharacterized protein A4U43_C05F12230 [Asparagus officinalis]
MATRGQGLAAGGSAGRPSGNGGWWSARAADADEAERRAGAAELWPDCGSGGGWPTRVVAAGRWRQAWAAGDRGARRMVARRRPARRGVVAVCARGTVDEQLATNGPHRQRRGRARRLRGRWALGAARQAAG